MTLATVLTLLAAATAAPAQVVIDPDSPSAKEYAIPLENERRQADPDTAVEDGVTQGERSSPLFGEGIEAPAREGGGEAEGKSRSSSSSGEDRTDGGGNTGATTGSEDTPAVVRAATSDPGAPDGGIGTTLAIAGVALAVVAVGGGAGLLLRRRS